jgi:hypothetical protein
MAAKFDKPDGNFDGFDAGALYQMVPVGQARPMAVITDGRGGKLRVGSPQFASLRNVRSTKPINGSITPVQTNLPPDSRTTFEIVGGTSGKTSLVFEDNLGKQITSLALSIKIPFKRTYNYCFVSDIRRSSAFIPSDVPKMFTKIARTFLVQANVVLEEQTPGGFAVNVTKDLGNPLVLNNDKIRNAILDATPLAAMAADFIVYLCWNILTPGQDVAGLAFAGTQFCFCEDNGFGSAGLTPLVIAHELGHLMGLDHFNDGLMTAVLSRSSQLHQFEIDTVNPS